MPAICQAHLTAISDDVNNNSSTAKSLLLLLLLFLMKLNISKTRTITMNTLNYTNYTLCDSCIILTDSIRALGVPINS